MPDDFRKSTEVENFIVTAVPAVQIDRTPPAPSRGDEVGACSVAVVDTDSGFMSLESEWDSLLSTAEASVFQTFEWISSWWKYFGSGCRLNCLVFKTGDRIVGIAPLFKKDVRILGLGVATHLQFIGCWLSDYVDMIIRPGSEQSVLRAFTDHLRATSGEWDLLDIQDVNERSALVKLFPDILRKCGFTATHYQGNVAPFIELPPTEDGLLSGGGHTRGYNYRRKVKRLREKFNASVELYRYQTDDVKGAVEMFSSIHGGRWKSLGHPSAFEDERHLAFHIEVSQKFAKRDWLRMFFLKVDHQPIAVNFAFNFHGRIYMYQSNAHASDEIMKCSPGFVIRCIAMIEGIKEGMKVFDFLRGDEPYKYREWGAVDSRNYLIRISSPLLLNRFRFALFLLWELAAKCRSRIQFEMHEYSRFRIIKRRSPVEKLHYVSSKTGQLLGMGFRFIIRHSPLRSLVEESASRAKEESDAS